jgi:integration host factor subunit beta
MLDRVGYFQEGRGFVNKSDLIEKLAKRSEITVQQSEQVVDLICRKMREALVDAGRVEIRGFLSFHVKEYGSRRGRNPRTGEALAVAAKKRPVFKPGKELRHRVDPLAAEEDNES